MCNVFFCNIKKVNRVIHLLYNIIKYKISYIISFLFLFVNNYNYDETLFRRIGGPNKDGGRPRRLDDDDDVEFEL